MLTGAERRVSSGVVADAVFHGYPEFSDGSGLLLAALATWRLHPAPFRLGITNTTVSIDGRWRFVRPLFPSRRIGLNELGGARLRGTLILLDLPNDEWWSFSTTTQYKKIAHALRARGVSVTED